MTRPTYLLTYSTKAVDELHSRGSLKFRAHVRM